MLENDSKSWPATRNTRVQNQIGALHAKPEYRFQNHTIHPSRGSGVPRPSAAPDVRGLRIHVRASDIWLDFISMNFARRLGVMNRIQHGQQLAGPIAVTLDRKRLRRPQRRMSILPAILADAWWIPLDVTGIFCRIVEGRRK